MRLSEILPEPRGYAEPIGVRLRGLETLEHETDPRLSHEQARRVVVLRALRFVRNIVLLQVGT
jgi:hypothetical protein